MPSEATSQPATMNLHLNATEVPPLLCKVCAPTWALDPTPPLPLGQEFSNWSVYQNHPEAC